MSNKQLSICIVGKNAGESLAKCIDSSLKICPEVIYVNLGSDGQGKSKASELGASVVDLDSLPSTLHSEWVLFLKPTEIPLVTSKKILHSVLSDKQAQGYLVYTRSNDAKNLLEKYQFIQNLEQYKKKC